MKFFLTVITIRAIVKMIVKNAKAKSTNKDVVKSKAVKHPAEFELR